MGVNEGGDGGGVMVGLMDGEMRVFDRAAVRRHRDRAAATVGVVAEVLRGAAERLLDRLDDTVRRFGTALDVGGRGVVAPLLRARGIEVVSCDLSPAMVARCGGVGVAADEEFLPFAPGSFDLVVASLSLHWVNDLPGALIQLRQALRPDGLLLASVPALGTLAELRQALTEAEAALTGGASPRVAVPGPAGLRGAAAAGGVRAAGGGRGGDHAALRRPAGAAAGAARGGGGERGVAAGSAGAASGVVSGRVGVVAGTGRAGGGDAAAGNADGVGACAGPAEAGRAGKWAGVADGGAEGGRSGVIEAL